MPEPVHETATAVAYLNQLAASLEMRGYPCEKTGYLDVPSRLLVSHPEVPEARETVTAVPWPDNEPMWWFSITTGFIGQCGHLREAVEFLVWLLTVRVERSSTLGPHQPRGHETET